MKLVFKGKQYTEEEEQPTSVVMSADKAMKFFEAAEKKTGKDLGEIKKAVLMQAWRKADEEGKKAVNKSTEVMVSMPTQIIQLSGLNEKSFSKVEEYDLDKLTDDEIRKLSDGAAIRLLDLDNEKAIRNIRRYVRRGKHVSMAGGSAAGSILGAIAGGLIGKDIKTAGLGATLGALLGLGTGTALGTSDLIKNFEKRRAYNAGHNQRKLTDRMIERIDRLRGDRSNLYGTYNRYRKLGTMDRNSADLADE